MSSAPGTGRRWKTGRPGARSPKSTAPTTGPGPRACATRGPRRRRYGAATSPRRPSSTPGSSGWSPRRSRRPRRRPARRAWHRHHRRPRDRSAPRRGGRVGRAGVLRPRVHRRRAAGRVQPARPGLGTAADAPPGPGGGRVRPLADLVSANLALGGGLRIDHVMGLSRLWWIPAGAPPTEGAYVYYDAQGTLGTLAASAAAAGSVVIGEDLGTVEPWLRDALAARGVLGTMMLWFERGWSNEPLAPQWWRHNSPRHGLHPRPAARRGLPVREPGDRPPDARAAHAVRGRRAGRGRPDGQRLDRGLRAARACSWPDERPSADEFTVALYGYLAKTPALLIGVNLAEVGRRDPLPEHARHLRRVPELEAPAVRPRRGTRPPRRPGDQRPGSRRRAPSRVRDFLDFSLERDRAPETQDSRWGPRLPPPWKDRDGNDTEVKTLDEGRARCRLLRCGSGRRGRRLSAITRKSPVPACATCSPPTLGGASG